MGTTYSTDNVFTTLGYSPYTQTKMASGIMVNSATLNAYLNGNLLPTTMTFEWGPSTSYGNLLTTTVTPDNGMDVNIEISGLSPEKEYHYRVKAENELGESYGNDLTFKTYSAKDADNNFYHSTVIGTQTWLTENLKTSRYDNGEPIGTTADPVKDITSESTPKYQWPAGSNESNVPVFGRLYTWYAVTDSRKLCPAGWHVPSNDEWSTLIAYLGGNIVGGKIKEYGTAHWSSPNDGAGGVYGFNALPAEGRTATGYFGGLTDLAYFWTASEYNTTDAWYWGLMYISPSIDNKKIGKNFGASVRCIKD